MTDIMTRDSHDVISMATDDDLDNITDHVVLQKLLEESEDLEFRRMVRAQLRKLKKGKQDSQPIIKPTKASTPEQRFIPQTNGVDAKVAGSNLRKTSVNSVKSSAEDANQIAGKLSETVKLRSTSVNKTNDDEKNKINQLEEVVLKSTPRNSAPPTSADRKGKVAYDVTLKHVSMTTTGSQSSGLPRRGNPTPRQALKHFKEMDNEALLRNAGTRDPQEALKRTSRNMNQNTIRDQTLNWCKNRLYSYENVNIEDFSSSWNDGLAFCALANSFFPEAFDYDELRPENRSYNFKLAFDTLEKKAGVVPLLEVEDMVATRHPDWKCVFTYVNCIIARMSEIRREREGIKDDVIDNIDKDRLVIGGDDDDDDKF